MLINQPHSNGESSVLVGKAYDDKDELAYYHLQLIKCYTTSRVEQQEKLNHEAVCALQSRIVLDQSRTENLVLSRRRL